MSLGSPSPLPRPQWPLAASEASEGFLASNSHSLTRVVSEGPGRNYLQRPPPLPPFLAKKQFSGEGGGGVYSEPPRSRNFICSLFCTPPTPRRVFSGVGGWWGCIKFGPVEGFFAEILRKLCGNLHFIAPGNSAEILRKARGNLRNIFCNDPFPNDPISELLKWCTQVRSFYGHTNQRTTVLS